ncbi:MAG: glycosyltransferase [Bacilli bacterium]
MKNIFIAANSLVVGGVEISLISFLNNIDLKKYNITLLLEDKVGELLSEIPKQVKIIEYKPLINGNILIRKIKNRIRFIKFIINNKNKYDVSICYASYIQLSEKIVRKICKNNYMWIHTDYTKIYNNENLKKFVKRINYKKFKNLVFVSEAAKKNYLNQYNTKKQNCIVCKNLIPYKKLIMNSKDKIDYKKPNMPTFLNISRHDEHAKKITRIIGAANLLKKDNIDFQILLIGAGKDTLNYQTLVKEKKLENNIIFLGLKENPYPYYKIADCFILTSNYEGGPITVYEALSLKTPVITTDVGDIIKYIKKNDGIIIEKNTQSLYKAMKEFINNKKVFKVNFDVNQFNKETLKTISNILDGRI